jgi:hypothetical protein
MYTRSDPYTEKVTETRTISKIESNEYELLVKEEGNIFHKLFLCMSNNLI